MIQEITHLDKEVVKKINALIGNPYTFLQKIKLKGVEAKRMIIEEVSPNLRTFVNTMSDSTYGSLELRSKGVLVHIHKGLQRFVWVVPFYQLYIYKTPSLSIHAQGRFVLFKPNKAHQENAPYIEKLIRLKNEFDQEHPHVDSIGLENQ